MASISETLFILYEKWRFAFLIRKGGSTAFIVFFGIFLSMGFISNSNYYYLLLFIFIHKFVI